MGLDYSYSQPSEDEDLFGNSVDSGYSETDELIRRDKAEISLHAGSPVQYPPQPEVEFGFPQICYCGAQPLVATSNSRNDPAIASLRIEDYGGMTPATQKTVRLKILFAGTKLS
ncbi:hypothetical protein Bca52824_063339 [Brassica carinata]|uniref:Uncharacterized protein n=1 Tax=Brassica carinata TaxID=52824 RepID=A0A8X7U845_BRACI|nr:hypothetical protein Bca52824_063339 [Brassica carinata]